MSRHQLIQITSLVKKSSNYLMNLCSWHLCWMQAGAAINDISPKIISISNMAQFCWSITFISFWNFTYSTTEILWYSGQNIETIWRLKDKFWTNEMSWNLDLRLVSEKYPFKATAPRPRTQYGTYLDDRPLFKELDNILQQLNQHWIRSDGI